MQPELKIADIIRSTLRGFLGAMAYKVISLHIKSKTGIDFSRPETVVGNVRVLEDLLHQTFRDSTVVLMEKVGNNLVGAFLFPDNKKNDNYNFQYSQLGDLATLIEDILKRNDSIAILRNAQDGDHFTMSYTDKDEFPSLLVTFLQRKAQNNSLNVLIISEDEKSRLQSFLHSSKRDHHGKSTMDFSDNNTLIVTHNELYGDLDSMSSFSFKPFMDGLNQARELAIQKQMSGLNIVGTLAGALYMKGRFEECLQIEEHGHEAIQQFPMPTTVMCLYEKPIDEQHRSPLLRCHNGGLHQI